MQFLMKLFKALNSAQTPWQVTLALALGMVAGLTPLSGVQNVLILFLAFLLNIHLGLFFVSAAFFAGIGYLFDPWFEQLGYAMLSAEGLRDLWTAWYNSPVMRLTHFNNTLVMGSTVVALALALPLYALLGWLIGRYRSVLAPLLEKYPRLGLMGILKVSQKRDPLLRWWGAGLFGGVAALLLFVGMVLVDPFFKWALESGGSALLQRDVRVGGVDVGFTDGTLAIRRIEIAGEEEGIDALSAELARIDLDLGALLLQRTHVERIDLKGVGFDTPATLAKAAAPKTSETASASENAEVEGALPEVALPTPESLLEQGGLTTQKIYADARSEIETMTKRWSDAASTDLDGSRLAALQKDFEALQKKSTSKDPKALLSLAKEVEAFQKKLSEEQKRLKTLKKAFDRDQKRITTLYTELETAATADFNRLKSAYDVASGGGMNIIGMIFGEHVHGYLETVQRYYALLAPYLQSEPEPPVPPRGSGRWMRYPVTSPDPDLWIAETAVDGTLKGQAFSAAIRDVSDAQTKVGRPVTFSMESDGPAIQALKVTGEDNRLGKTPLDRVDFEAAGMAIDALEMQGLTMTEGVMAFRGAVSLEDGAALSGKSRLSFSDTTLGFASDDANLKAVASLLEDIHAFKADIKLGGSLLSPDVGVSTDLDKQLASAAGAKVSEKAKAYEKELRQKLEAQTASKRSELKGDAAGIPQIDQLVGTQNGQLDDLGSSAEKLLKKEGGGGLPVKLPF